MTSEMMLCRFCRGDAEVQPYPIADQVWFTVVCRKCAMRTGAYRTSKQAISAWNTRPLAPAAAEIVRLAEAWVVAGICRNAAYSEHTQREDPVYIVAWQREEKAKLAFTTALSTFISAKEDEELRLLRRIEGLIKEHSALLAEVREATGPIEKACDE